MRRRPPHGESRLRAEGDFPSSTPEVVCPASQTPSLSVT
ncbi:hypothetical protein Mx9_p12 [Myxococcus phage Mx9]|nr:hypothetical protein Mx9_p12 [Myxococcus phage Mx9]